MLTQTTKLQAVNEVLSAGGEERVNAINTPEADDALQYLEQQSRTLQARGWWFNTTCNRTLYPNTEGLILLPANVLKVIPEEGRYTLRGNKLFDAYGDGLNFDRPVVVDYVEGLEWEDLPEDARTLITLSASRKYQDNLLGDPNAHTAQSQEEMVAYQALCITDVNAQSANIFRNKDIARSMVRGSTVRAHHLHSVEQFPYGGY